MPTLVVRADRIGDVVLATSVIEAIAEKYPEEELFFLTSTYAKAVVEGNPHIFEILSVNEDTNIERIIRWIKERKIDKAIILFPTFKLSWAIFRAGVKNRVGAGFRWYQPLFTKTVYLRRSKATKKEWEYNLELAAYLFPEIEKKEPVVYLKEEEIEKAANLLKSFPRPIIGVYPGGGKEKRWKAENFVKLCKLIEEEVGFPLVLWGPSEKEILHIFEKRWLSPELNLRELISVISQLDAFVTNNTGPMHIAASFKKPLVQIFDPRKAVNPKRWGYEYPKAVVIKPEVPTCKKCRESCPYYDCMDRIPVETVFRELKRCIGKY